MPWYEVTVKASQLIAVEAKDADEAAQFAFDEAFGMSDDCVKECDHPKAPVEGFELESLKRHADIVLPMDDEE